MGFNSYHGEWCDNERAYGDVVEKEPNISTEKASCGTVAPKRVHYNSLKYVGKREIRNVHVSRYCLNAIYERSSNISDEVGVSEYNTLRVTWRVSDGEVTFIPVVPEV